jgi:hypothetical protein
MGKVRIMKSRIWLVALVGISGFSMGQEPVVGSKDPEKLFTSPHRKLNANKQVVLHIVRDLLEAGHWSEAPKYISQRYNQHNPNVPSGLDPVMKFFNGMPSHRIPGRYSSLA